MNAPRPVNRALVIAIALAAAAVLVAVDAHHRFPGAGAPPAPAGNPQANPRLAALGARAGTLPGLARSAAGADGKLDLVFAGGRSLAADTGTVDLDAPSDITIEGWAVAAAPSRPLARVVTEVDGGAPQPATYGRPRADVAAALHCEGCVKSGFAAPVAASKLTAGTHDVAFFFVLPDGSHYVPGPTLMVHVGGR